MGLSERWRKHVRRAFHENRNHPLYNAIRKYGQDTFKVETIDHAASKTEAQDLERKYIAEAPEPLLYNLSPGGEADGEYGAEQFWRRLNANPEAREAYLRKLSEVKKRDDWSDYETMCSLAQDWRKQNPREAYKNSRRAIRIASQGRPEPQEDTRSRKEQLMWIYKRGVMTRKNANTLWASRTTSERAEIGQLISAGRKRYWGNITDEAERSRLTAAARTNIDREKQGAAASRGLKMFWENLKADPERYREYMDRRTQSLKKTQTEKSRSTQARTAQAQ